jgi:lipopolysaccharide/colanic/teichoic acid biosynthesis glycosyltransferase
VIYESCKRVFDVCFSLLALALLWLPLVIIAIFISVDSPGGAIYRGERTGKGGRPFRIRKFRTMVADAEFRGGPSTALNDARITRIGRLLRKSKLDELPQLIDIFSGTMSFVGPRPQVKKYTDLYTEEENIILSVKPGLTDYASIYFVDMDSTLGEIDVDEYYLREVEPVKNRLRLRYVHERSFGLDMKLICETVLRIFGMKFWNIEP